ncbi:MAG: response regulator [Myxococcales bacterium]|nr:response regulator [Myxococcales bacterium]
MADATRIFMVDDETAIIEAIGRLLEDDGFVVERFHSPSAAIEACTAAPPAFVITDFLMAEMSGQELAATLRSELGSRCPRIVCVTGWLIELRADQIELFDRVLEKPFAYCDLVRVLDELEQASASPANGRMRLDWDGGPSR